MDFFKKVKIRYTTGKIVRRFYFFGVPLFQYSKKENGRKSWRLVKENTPPHNDQRIFYLKVNRIHQTSYDCIQHWLDVIARLDGFCYFVCDKKEMEYGIFQKPCFFYNDNFAFIRSDRTTLKNQISKLLHGVERQKLWQRIAASMLTPFIHAAKNDFKRSYNIDADDIMLLAKPELIAGALKKAEAEAEVRNVDCLNFDMFVSKSLGVHWSFGIVYVRKPQKCLDVISSNLNWRENDILISKYNTQYVNKFNFNVDWLFTFLRDTKQLNLQTFYIKNATVVHMPDISISRHWAFTIQWQGTQIYFPIIDKLYADKKWTKLPIYKDCIEIDSGIKIDSYIEFMNEFYSTTYWFENEMLNIALNRNLIDRKLFNTLI